MIYKTPPINSRGKYIVKSPFDRVILPNVIYECKSIRTIQDMTINDNIYERIYKPLDISKEQYNDDVNNGVLIISLLSEHNNRLLIPNKYIESFPSSDGVLYQSKALGIPLGPQLSNIDLTDVKLAVKDTIKNLLGVNSTVKEIATSKKTYIDYNQHLLISSLRNTNRADNQSYYNLYLDASAKITDLLEHITKLECFIRNNGCGNMCIDTTMDDDVFMFYDFLGNDIINPVEALLLGDTLVLDYIQKDNGPSGRDTIWPIDSGCGIESLLVPGEGYWVCGTPESIIINDR